jgi:hypothetical protein
MASMQRRGNAAVRSVRPFLTGARPAAFQLSSRLLSVQKNEPITHIMQYQVTAIARQKHEHAYHHQEAYTNKGQLLAASAAAIATFVVAQEADRSQCHQSSGGQQKDYDELVLSSFESEDWPKVAALYEEMIGESATPRSQTSLWAAAAYIDADQEHKALPIIEKLTGSAPKGSTRMVWASAYMTAGRWHTALDLLQEPMHNVVLDRWRHYLLCTTYLLTNRLEDLKTAIEHREHLRAGDLDWLRSKDLRVIMRANVLAPDKLMIVLQGTAKLVMPAVYGDILGALNILDEFLSEGRAVDDLYYDLLSVCCEAHGRSDLLPTLQLLKQSQASVEQS